MSDAKVLYAKHNGVVVLKLIGSFSFSLESSKILDAFINELLVNDDFENVLIDLSETNSLDSTHLGLLAMMTRITMELYNRKATIISTNDDVTQTLEGVGFREVFHIVHDPIDPGAELEELEDDSESSENATAKLVLNAHKELMEISEENVDAFKNVVDMLESQISEKQ